jgi:hypothetical protein
MGENKKPKAMVSKTLNIFLQTKESKKNRTIDRHSDAYL